MDCECLEIDFVEEVVSADFVEELLSFQFVEETIEANIVEETIEANIAEETLEIEVESAIVSYDGTFTQQVETDIEAGENIGALRVIKNNSDYKGYIADSSDVAQINQILGISKTASVAGNSVRVIMSGKMEDASWNWDVTKAIYFDSNGQLTQTPPSSGFSLMVGVAITNKIINVEIKQSIKLI